MLRSMFLRTTETAGSTPSIAQGSIEDGTSSSTTKAGDFNLHKHPIPVGDECPICYETFQMEVLPSTPASPGSICSSSDTNPHKDSIAFMESFVKSIFTLGKVGGSGSEDDDDCNAVAPHSRERMVNPECGHEFCRECLRDHCRHSISIRQVPIPCPAKAADKCESVLPMKQVETVLLKKHYKEDASSPINLQTSSSPPLIQQTPSLSKYGSMDWVKFERLHRISQDKSLISCTRCENLVSTKDNTTSILCPTCGHTFCRTHGDAHPGQSCQEYIQFCHLNEQIQQSEEIIRQTCKPCSHCHAPIEKEAGCDHIVCPACHQDMCFKCGTHTYLKGKSMIRNCKKCEQSFVDHRYIGRYRLLVCLTLPFYLPFFILHVAVVGALAIASCGCLCCLGCGVKIRTKKDPSSSRTVEEYIWRPRLAALTVLGIVFLPFVDLFHQCGIPCCFNIDISALADNDDDYDDDNGKSSKDEADGGRDKHVQIDDEEQQLNSIEKSTTLKTFDGED